MKRTVRQVSALMRLGFLELVRRHDVFALLVLALALLVPLAAAKPFGADGATRYMDEMALLLIWGFSLFLSLGAGARLFPPEFENRTVLVLFSKPISRARLLVGKYLGAVIAVGAAVTFFYALYAVAVVCRGGAVGTWTMAEAWLFHLAFVALAVAVSLLGSLVVTRSANLVLSAGTLIVMFFFGRRLLAYAEGLSAPVAALVKLAYALGPHVEFFDMRQRLVHDWGAADAAVVAAVLGYAAAYVAVLLALASLRLARRRV